MPGGIVVPSDGIVKTQLMEVFVRREGRWWIEASHTNALSLDHEQE
jgi:hypothetical protein